MPQISDVGLAIVKAFESCLKPIAQRPGWFKPYLCPAGVLTIGWGHTNHHQPKFYQSDVWSQAQCDLALKGDMAVFERHVRSNAPALVDQYQFDALVSWSFNTGGPADSAVWTYARTGDVAATCVRLKRWNKANGKVLAGLVRRRQSEAELYQGEVEAALATAGATRLLGPMAQRVDRPSVPAAEVAKQTKGAASAAAGGAVIASGAGVSKTGTVQPDPAKPEPKSMSASSWAVALGLVVLVVAIVVIVKKRKALQADYA